MSNVLDFKPAPTTRFRVWAKQTLYAETEITALTIEQARAIAERMFLSTGELDPATVITGECGAEPVDPEAA
jgi:hypothetical protein